MIVVMHAETPQAHIDAVITRVHELGFKTNVQVGEEQTVVGLVGSGINQDLADLLASMPGVDKTLRVSGTLDITGATLTGLTAAQVNAAAGGTPVLTSGAQTIAGAKTFSDAVTFDQTIDGDINGNAATVTGGVYTSSLGSGASKIPQHDANGERQSRAQRGRRRDRLFRVASQQRPRRAETFPAPIQSPRLSTMEGR